MMPAALVAVALSLAAAGSAELDQERLDLRQLLARAAQTYPELKVVAAELDQAEALRSLAFWTRFTPTLRSTTAFGLVPAARGDINSSPDTNRDLNDLGPFYRERVDAFLPLITFGRASGNQRAAETLVAARQAKAEVKLADAVELSARAYFGWLLADRQVDLVADIRKDVHRLIEQIEHPGEDDEEPDPLDLFKVRSYEHKLDRAEAMAEAERAVAAEGLNQLGAAPPGRQIRPAATDLVPLATTLPDREAGLAEALAHNPDLRQADLAAQAKQEYARAEGKTMWPMIGLEGRIEFAEANNREPQENPFVYDPWNSRTLAFGMMMRWDLNYFQNRAEAAALQADARALRAGADGLRMRTQVEVVEAHGRLERALRIYESSRRAMSQTANWLRLAEENHGLGTASVNDVVDAYENHVETRRGHDLAVYDLNLAVIGWRLLLGRPPLESGETP